MRELICTSVGIVVNTLSGGLSGGKRHLDERGLSQSTETAILIAGALIVAGAIVTAITIFVNNNLPK